MYKTKVFTSSLPIDLTEEVENYAITNKVPKNKVIELALRAFFKGIERKEFVESLKKYGRDPEFKEMAEWGIHDFTKQLDKYPYETR